VEREGKKDVSFCVRARAGSAPGGGRDAVGEKNHRTRTPSLPRGEGECPDISQPRRRDSVSLLRRAKGGRKSLSIIGRGENFITYLNICAGGKVNLMRGKISVGPTWTGTKRKHHVFHSFIKKGREATPWCCVPGKMHRKGMPLSAVHRSCCAGGKKKATPSLARQKERLRDRFVS